ncbi:MAG: hypothetical protein VX111_06030, partial [Planctomycetota bacterium]|nr:hypothetical protein [Planctomycetota bacterium]
MSLRVRIRIDDENSQKPLWRPTQSTFFWSGQFVCKGVNSSQGDKNLFRWNSSDSHRFNQSEENWSTPRL